MNRYKYVHAIYANALSESAGKVVAESITLHIRYEDGVEEGVRVEGSTYTIESPYQIVSREPYTSMWVFDIKKDDTNFIVYIPKEVI